MPFGYTGKILRVDLTHAKLEIEEPPESFYRKYMGGSAMGMYYILKEVPTGVEAAAPENVLTLMLSVTTGAPISGQSRLNVNAKSPISGGMGDSQSGGFFPAELKFAGFDGIVIKGRSPKPIYLSILHGEAKLQDAAHLIGKVTGEVDALLKQEVGDSKAEVLQHGPGAENGVLPLEHIYMSYRLYPSVPVRGSCPNRNWRLRRDFCGDIVAGVPIPRALRIELTQDDQIPSDWLVI